MSGALRPWSGTVGERDAVGCTFIEAVVCLAGLGSGLSTKRAPRAVGDITRAYWGGGRGGGEGGGLQGLFFLGGGRGVEFFLVMIKKIFTQDSGNAATEAGSFESR